MKQVWEGVLQKMRTEASAPVSYFLRDAAPGSDAPELAVNPLIGAQVSLRFTGNFVCTACGKTDEHTFDNGYCSACMKTRADADMCMMKPHLCHHGREDYPCRDEVFAVERCFQPHYLYASLTSDVKVGITRHTNVPSRWIDQGAVLATTLARLPSRRAVGLVEHAMAEDFKDRTHWMKMLKGTPDESALDETVARMEQRLGELGAEGVLPVEQRIRTRLVYPLDAPPEKVKSTNLEKVGAVTGLLLGIKGQYWIFEGGAVVNIRRHSGHCAEISVE